MRKGANFFTVLLGLLAAFCLVEANLGQTPPQAKQQKQQKTRRSQRVRMEQVQVASPDGRVKFTLLPNAERLTYTVTMGDTTVIEPSPVVMHLDGYDLSAGVVSGAAETFQINETYPWHGVNGTATNHCNGVRIPLEHDLSSTTTRWKCASSTTASHTATSSPARRASRACRMSTPRSWCRRLHGLVSTAWTATTKPHLRKEGHFRGPTRRLGAALR